MKAKILRAIVWLGVYEFGSKCKSTVHLARLMINQPMMIEIIDEEEKIQPLLLPLRQMIGDNGFITINRV